MERITEQGFDFNQFTRRVFQEVCRYTAELIADQMELLDEKLMNERDKSIYRHLGIRETTVTTFIGDIKYFRRYYRKTESEMNESATVFLLDEYLGIDQYIGKFNDDIVDLVTNRFMDMSCRKAARAITEGTIIDISHTTVWTSFNKVGQQHENRMEQLVVLNSQDRLIGPVETKVLFEEADGITISIQGKDRPKGYGNRELKIASAYTGWKLVGENRYETVDKIAYASFESTTQFKQKAQSLKAATYDVDGIDITLYGSDGGHWCKTYGEEADIFSLDQYHRNKAATRCLEDKEHRKQLMSLFADKHVDMAIEYLEALINSYEDPEQVEKTRDLLEYYQNNKEGLLSWKEREIELPEPPKGIVYRNMGVQEHTNANVICSRMKNNGTSWSIEGGNHMALMLSLRVRKGNPDWIYDNSIICNKDKPETSNPLSAAQVPITVGKGYNGLRQGGWPFENVSTTIGRKQIKDIFEQKHLSLIRYQG
jgi:hypothetical protein